MNKRQRKKLYRGERFYLHRGFSQGAVISEVVVGVRPFGEVRIVSSRSIPNPYKFEGPPYVLIPWEDVA